MPDLKLSENVETKRKEVKVTVRNQGDKEAIERRNI
jgi:hypothetical protein